MTGLILKDLINLKINFRRFSLIIVIYAGLAMMSKDSSFFSSIFTMLFALLIMSTYSYDEMAKWDVYALTLPISRDNIVQGKYLTALILTSLGTAVGSFFTILINIVMKRPSVTAGLDSSLLGAGIILLFYCIAMPIITKLGVEKGRYVFLAIYMIPYLCIFLFNSMANKVNVSEDVVRMLQYVWNNIAVILPIILVIAIAISYRISIGIYRKKEF